MSDTPPDPAFAALLADLPQGVRYERTEYAEVLGWSNWELPKQWGIFVVLPLFWVIWTPITLGITYGLIEGSGPSVFLAIWLIFGWIGVIGIPYSISSVLWHEEVGIEAECVHFRIRCFGLSFEKTRSFLEIHGLCLGKYYAGQEDEFDGQLTVVLTAERTAMKCIRLAYPASLKAKKRIFPVLRELLRRRKPELYSYCQDEEP